MEGLVERPFLGWQSQCLASFGPFPWALASHRHARGSSRGRLLFPLLLSTCEITGWLMAASTVSEVCPPAMPFAPCSPHAMISSVAGHALRRFPASLRRLGARTVQADVARLHRGAPSYHTHLPRD
jgi:hypothetical protein